MVQVWWSPDFPGAWMVEVEGMGMFHILHQQDGWRRRKRATLGPGGCVEATLPNQLLNWLGIRIDMGEETP